MNIFENVDMTLKRKSRKEINDELYICDSSPGTVHYVVYDVPNSASISRDNLNILTSLIKNSIIPIPFSIFSFTNSSISLI